MGKWVARMPARRRHLRATLTILLDAGGEPVEIREICAKIREMDRQKDLTMVAPRRIGHITQLATKVGVIEKHTQRINGFYITSYSISQLALGFSADELLPCTITRKEPPPWLNDSSSCHTEDEP